MRHASKQPNAVIVAGADWCGDTRATLAFLQDAGVPFEYFNVDDDERAAEWVREQNGGKQKLPTVDVAGKILSIPSTEELEAAVVAAMGKAND